MKEPSFFPVLPLANQIFALVKQGNFLTAETILREAGYPDAAQQVKDLYGFILQYGKVKK